MLIGGTPKLDDSGQLLPPTLNAHQAHVWFVSDVTCLPGLSFLMSLLTGDERNAAERRVVASDQVRSKACRGLLRQLLSIYVSGDPATLLFDYSPHGKPYLKDPTSPVSFNLSHSGDAVAFALAHTDCVGIDIERIREIPDARQIVDRHFSDRDREWFHSIPPLNSTNAFFRLWTRKEAVAKAVGKGLLLPMDSFDVSRGYGIARESTEVPVKEATSLRLKLIDLPLPSEFTGAAAVNIDTQVLTGKLSCTAQGNLSFLLR